MGSLPNSSQCGGSSNERLLENDYYNSCSDSLKKQEVSVIREFPPGTGLDAPSINLLLQGMDSLASFDDKEKLGADGKPANVAVRDCGKASEIEIASVAHQLVKNLVKSELTNSLDILVGKVVNATWKDNGVELAPIEEPLGSGLLKGSDKYALEFPKESPKVDNQAVMKRGAYESKTMFEIDSTADGINLEGVAKQWSPAHLPISITNISKQCAMENKYPRRKFSLVRDFPPFCGRNAPRLTEEERLRVISGNKPSGGGSLREVKRAKELNGEARDGFSSKRKLGERETVSELKPKSLKTAMQGRPMMEIGRADVKISPVREKASGPMKKDLLSYGKASNEIKGVQVVDMRNKVKETLDLFHSICRKLLQGQEAKKTGQERSIRRVDLEAAKIIRAKRKEVNTEKQRIGSVPGVEVGDEFIYRVELALVGIHRHYQAGIDFMKHSGIIIATSIVASGGYADDLANADVLIYSGQGGNLVGRNKKPKDQKLEKGNLALKNCISAKTPVRVIRGFKETETSTSYARAKIVSTYTYDGLYMVERHWREGGSHGKLVYMFELKRIPGQQKLTWRKVK